MTLAIPTATVGAVVEASRHFLYADKPQSERHARQSREPPPLTPSVSADLTAHVQRVVEETSAARVSLQQSLGTVVEKIEGNTRVTAQVAERFNQGAKASDEIAAGWQANAQSNTELAQQLREISSTERGATGVLEGLGAGAAKVLERVEAAVSELHAVATQLRSLDSASRARAAPDIVVPRTPVATPAAGLTAVVPTIADLQPQRPNPNIAAIAATGLGIPPD